ncbi:MAG: hypothetical protein JNL23_11775 [Chitinophagaceae bacterium]|nr:hypothetical protein [Chitinophagaceae bacterium]
MIPIETRIIVPRKFPILIILVLIIWGIASVDNKSTIPNARFYLIALVLLVFGGLYLSLANTYIVIDNLGISLKQPFKKLKSFDWQEISQASWDWSIDVHTVNLSWIIYSNKNTNISVQPSFYKRKDLQIIAEVLIRNCPQANIHNKIKKASEGKFPWYLF